MKTVLMVAYYFPPIATSGAMRPLAFCRHLPASGWQPRVIAAEPTSVSGMPIDKELAARIPGGVHVDRRGHANLLDTLIRLRDHFRQSARSPMAAASSGSNGSPARTSRLGQAKELMLEHAFLVPDPQSAWRRHAVAAGRSGTRPDLVYATGGPWTSLLAGRDLARRYRVPFVADFRDPWTRNPVQRRSPSAQARSRRLERLVCRDATVVIANTVELREQFSADYPDMAGKFIAITNGFDTSAVQEGDPGGVANREGAPRELVHFGTIYGTRTPAPLLTAVSQLLHAGTLAPGSLRIRFIGNWELDESDPASQLARSLERAGMVFREPAVSHQECMMLMRQADTLLVLQAASPLQIPGKIYEYIATGRPLLLVGGEGATASLVGREGLGRSCPNDVDEIAALIAELATAGDEPSRLDAAARFDYSALTTRLAAVFDAALHDHSSMASERLEKNALHTLDGLR